MFAADWSNATACETLQRIRFLHVQLRTCLAEMEALTAQPTADRLAYTSARFRISKASLERRTAFNAVCTELSKAATDSEKETIARLRADDSALMGYSATHVTKWTADTISDDWTGYCKASRAIRQHMARELDNVERNLFPILQRRSLRLRGRLTDSQAA